MEAELVLDFHGGSRALAMLDCDAELAAQFDAMCAKVFEATSDLDDRYYLMKECGKYTTGETWTEMREGIARWATAEQLAFYDEMRQKHSEHSERMMSAARSAAADADAENQRRLDAYAAQQAAYQENRSAIEDVSQIGALDPSERAPDAPELITSASVNITHIDSGSVPLPPVQLTVVNKCGENIATLPTSALATARPARSASTRSVSRPRGSRPAVCWRSPTLRPSRCRVTRARW